jgi:acyl-coenzyme A thioesterase PaaI-like protein
MAKLQTGMTRKEWDMGSLRRINWFLKAFGIFKVPLIAYVNPKVIHYDDTTVIAKIKLNRRNKNHLGSMYFGALAIGADVAGGISAVIFAESLNQKISLAFKSVKGEFIKRPEDDVIFTCADGEAIQEMIRQSIDKQERINQMVTITATCPTQFDQEPVAVFQLELSIRAIN